MVQSLEGRRDLPTRYRGARPGDIWATGQTVNAKQNAQDLRDWSPGIDNRKMLIHAIRYSLLQLPSHDTSKPALACSNTANHFV